MEEEGGEGRERGTETEERDRKERDREGWRKREGRERERKRQGGSIWPGETERECVCVYWERKEYR